MPRLTAGGIVALLLLAGMPARGGAADPAGPPSSALMHQCRPGPWGEMEYSRIVIEPPDDFIPANYVAPPSRWNFPGFTPAQLEQLGRDAGLDDAQRQALQDPAIMDRTAEGLALRPGDELVRSLSAESRARLYNTLARLPGNPLQTEPFRFRAEIMDEWFKDCDLPAPIVAAVRSLCYRRGSALAFSDLGLVLPQIPAAADRARLLKTLARKSTLLLKVRIGPGSDIDTIAEYWGNGRRRKDVKPLLQSLSRHPGGMPIDVVHLLPRFARALLYTYPDPDAPAEMARDCHWTSMNFFNDPPEARFADIAYLKDILIKTYAPVRGAPTMGDLLMLTRADGEVIHSCIYLGDDIVFSKNGQSASVPWTLTTIQDLQAFYPEDPPLQVRMFRLKQ
ncbi:MAG: hypothetical protein PSV13_15490 [Lacunisphaera sp.]|nr:hypothetical protein [Lacunisphaera sp.]